MRPGSPFRARFSHAMRARGVPWARKLVYFPAATVPPIEHVLPEGHEVGFMTEDGMNLKAWFLAGRTDDAATVLVLHGNGGNRASRAPLALALRERGFAVLLTDYRGYGGSDGSPSEEGLASDARAAQAWLLERQGVAPARLVFFGESLGSAVATRLACETPPAALVLRSPFTSLEALALHHYRGVPTFVLPDRYPTIDRIGSIASATLVVAGSRDTIVPLAESERVFEAATEPKRLLVVPGADHNDLALLSGDSVIDEMVTFIEQYLPR